MKKIIIAALLATTSLAQANDIYFSEKIKNSMRNKLLNDMAVLDNLKYKEANPRTLEVLGIPALNTSSSVKWLNDRVKYVIEEDALSLLKLLFKKTIYVEQTGVSFPNGDVLPYFQEPGNQLTTPEEKKRFIAMSNIGAAMYSGGKSNRTLYGIKVSRGLLKKQIKVVIDSPRSGVIQVGEGLFLKEVTVNNENPESIANSFKRLVAFFHEARHSDGNGSSLGFAHSKCPVGHDYAEAYACDENLNGPYTVGALMTTEMLKACDDSCSEREKEILKLIALDSAGRVMTTTHKGTQATDWNAAPESL